VFSDDIDFVSITGPADQLTIIQRLIWLKNDAKATKSGQQQYPVFELEINKDLTNQGDH
jgi:hypothetical protein